MWVTRSGITVQRLLGGRSNVFLAHGGDASVLVDTSWRLARYRLQAALDSLGFHNERQLGTLFITHAHFDHAANAAWIRARYQPQVIIQQNEADFLRTGRNPPVGGSADLTRLLLPEPVDLGQAFVYPPVEPDITFDETFDLRSLGLDAYLLHTAGHSPGSSCLIVCGEIAVVGDTLHSVFPRSAHPPFAMDDRELIESWAKLLDSGCRLFLPAHGHAVDRSMLETEYRRRRAA